MSKPLVAIFTANSHTGTSCIEEIYARYLDRVRVRGVFRSDEKAASFREKYPDMDIVTGCDASKPETLGKAFAGAQAALIVTPYDSKAINWNDRFSNTMIEHAVANGVRYIVYISAFSVSSSQEVFAQYYAGERLLEKLATEKGIKYTVVVKFYLNNITQLII